MPRRTPTHYRFRSITGHQVAVPWFMVDEGQVWEGPEAGQMTIVHGDFKFTVWGSAARFMDDVLYHYDYRGRRPAKRKEKAKCLTLVQSRG